MKSFIYFTRSKLSKEIKIRNLFENIEKTLKIKLPQAVAIRVTPDIDFETITIKGKSVDVLVLNYPGYTFLSDRELEFSIVYAWFYSKLRESKKIFLQVEILKLISKHFSFDEKIDAITILVYFSYFFQTIIEEVRANPRSKHLLYELDHDIIENLGKPDMVSIVYSVCQDYLGIPAIEKNLSQIYARFKVKNSNCISSLPKIQEFHKNLIAEDIVNGVEKTELLQPSIEFLKKEGALSPQIWEFLNGDGAYNTWHDVTEISFECAIGCTYTQINNLLNIRLQLGYPALLTYSNWELKFRSDFWKAYQSNYGAANLVKDTIFELLKKYSFEQIFFAEMNYAYHEILYKNSGILTMDYPENRTPSETLKMFLELENQMSARIPTELVTQLVRETKKLMEQSNVNLKLDRRKLNKLIAENDNQDNILKKLPNINQLRERFACQLHMALREREKNKEVVELVKYVEAS